MEGFGRAFQIYQREFGVAAELPEDLAAGAAWRREYVGIGGDGDAREFARAFRDCFEDGDSLCADS
jgi:hypothetical protein